MKFLTVLSLFVSLLLSQLANAGTVKKILVVLSSEDHITVLKSKETGELTSHPTGFFLSELMVPLMALKKAGYEPVYASPKGGYATMDKVSDSAFWFAGNEEKYNATRKACEQEGLCGTGVSGTKKIKTLESVLSSGLNSYAGILVPGGHAPMEDLWRDKTLGKILTAFHQTSRPTALICHGPIALLSAMSNPEKFGALLADGKQVEASKHAKDWIYTGYKMTIFSTKEEQHEEPGQDNLLGGWVKFYPDEALDIAGGKVLVRAQKWQGNVIRDRELITGQNPFSDESLAKEFISALNEQKNDNK